MNIMSVDKLYDYNYSIEVINALKLNWTIKQTFSCMGKPKEINMLLYISGCKAEYTLPDGSTVYAESGDVVYTPLSYEYSLKFFDFEEENHYTIGVNFFLFDEVGEPFILSDKIIVFHDCKNGCASLFGKINKYSETTVVRPSKMKAAMYDNLSYLSSKSRKKNIIKERFAVIAEGINYLEHDEAQRLSIREVARLCNVSEIYFRRLFKEYSGTSPIQFRIQGKIEKAKTLLEYENMPVSEISEHLGFTSTAYFTKQFRLITGKTPSQYRKG